MLLNISSDITSSIYATETQSTFSCSIETEDSTSSSKEISSSNKPIASSSEMTTISSNDITSSNKETSSFSKYITSSSKLTATPSKVTTSSHKHVPLTKVTTVITTDNHVVTLTTLVPCSFSKSEQSTSKPHTSGETQASLSESANSNPATGDTSLHTTSMSIMNVKSSTQYSSHADTLSESNLPSTEKASAETTKTLCVTSKQTNNQTPPFANGTSTTQTFSATTVNTLVSASLSTSTMSYETSHSFSPTTNPGSYALVYTSHTDFDLTKESQGQTEETTLTTSATSKCASTTDVQLQTSTVTEMEGSVITTKTDEHATDLSNGNSIDTSNVIHPTVSKTFVAPSTSKSRMNNISAYTSRISFQQVVNGASQNKICHPLFSIFLLFTSMYI